MAHGDLTMGAEFSHTNRAIATVLGHDRILRLEGVWGVGTESAACRPRVPGNIEDSCITGQLQGEVLPTVVHFPFCGRGSRSSHVPVCLLLVSIHGWGRSGSSWGGAASSARLLTASIYQQKQKQKQRIAGLPYCFVPCRETWVAWEPLRGRIPTMGGGVGGVWVWVCQCQTTLPFVDDDWMTGSWRSDQGEREEGAEGAGAVR
ncbi:hypothetical protein QBC39DRAFT_46287 [Podospora conica]|nr:hypothetical protein QBC39DRAFT_46287 [Schizothecium conicum]